MQSARAVFPFPGGNTGAGSSLCAFETPSLSLPLHLGLPDILIIYFSLSEETELLV